jgi:hypothetical protein
MYCEFDKDVPEDYFENDDIYKLMRELGIILHYPPYDSDGAYIGIPIEDMTLDETLGEFKRTAEEKLRRLLKKEVRCDLVTEGWVDG